MRKSKQLRAQNILLKRAQKDVLGKYRQTLELTGLADKNGQAMKIAQDPRNKKEDKVIDMSISNFSNMSIDDELLGTIDERNNFFKDQIKHGLECTIGDYSLGITDNTMKILLDKLHTLIYASIINFIPLFDLNIDGILKSLTLTKNEENLKYIKDKVNSIYTDMLFMYSSLILNENIEILILDDLSDNFKLGAFYTLMQHNMMMQDSVRMDNLDKIFFFGMPKELSSFRLAELDGKWYTPMDFDERTFTQGTPSKRILNIIEQSMLDKKIQEFLVSKFHNDKESIEKIYEMIGFNDKQLDYSEQVGETIPYDLDAIGENSKVITENIIKSKLDLLREYIINNSILTEDELNIPLYKSFKVKSIISKNNDYIIIGPYLIDKKWFLDTTIEELAQNVEKFIKVSNFEEYEKVFKKGE